MSQMETALQPGNELALPILKETKIGMDGVDQTKAVLWIFV